MQGDQKKAMMAVVFGEALKLPHILGIALVILSIIAINIRIRKQYLKKFGEYIPPLLDLTKFYRRDSKE